MTAKLVEVLALLIEPFRFIKHARERRLKEVAELREHMVDMLDTVLGRLEATEQHRSLALIESAKAQQAQATALQTWFEMFKHDSMNNSPGTTVRPADEYDAEQQRMQEKLIELGYPVEKSPAEQMAWLLSHDHLQV
jgi:DNA-binding protein H-NS